VLDRVPDYESVGRRFESCQARQKIKGFAHFEQPLFFYRQGKSGAICEAQRWVKDFKPGGDGSPGARNGSGNLF
jgi:hypothetical protein